MSLPPPPPLSSLPPPPPPRESFNNSNGNTLNLPPPPPSFDSSDNISGSSSNDVKLVTINHRSLVNNQTFADVHLIVGKKILYAHSYILQLRAPKLLEIKGVPIKKKKGLVVREMNKDTRDNILLEVLGYIYVDDIDFSKMSVPDVLQVNAYAMEFEVNRLVWKCENHLREMLTNENVYEVLIESNRAAQARIKEFCFHFIVNHYDAFITNKSKTSTLGIELFQDAIAVNQQKELGTLKPLDLKPCPPSTLIEDFKKIYEGKDSIEATIFRVGIGMVQYVTCHKALLAGQSPQLQALCLSPLSKAGKDAPESIPLPPLRTRSVFDSISSDAFETLLKYTYFGFADIPPLHAAELIPFSIDYSLGELQRICYQKISESINEKTALAILGVTYVQPPEGKEGTFLFQPSDVESTRKNATDFILSHLAESDLTLLPRMFPKIAVDLVMTNQRKERVQKGMPVEPILNIVQSASGSKGDKKLDKGVSSAALKKDKKEKK